jgi:hypothetical protein
MAAVMGLATSVCARHSFPTSSAARWPTTVIPRTHGPPRRPTTNPCWWPRSEPKGPDRPLSHIYDLVDRGPARRLASACW